MMDAQTVIHPVGDDALCLPCADKALRNSIAKTLRSSGGWLAVIPGASDVTVQYDPVKETYEAAEVRLIAAMQAEREDTGLPNAELTIPVCYYADYAPDMSYVCRTLNLSVEEVIARHTAWPYRVDMIGFTPGFAYLEEGSITLDVPRLDVPRTHVAAGSVGLAGGLCGLYALAGPGGWPIIGRTPLTVFDSGSDTPFLLSPGMQVRFRAISKSAFESWTE